MKSAQPLTVARMTALVARDASFTFGGGTAIAESLRREFVEHRRSLTEADFQRSYAASRLTPGTNILALCTVLGWWVGGRSGAAAVLVASSVPTAMLVAIAAAGYGVVMSAPGVAAGAALGWLAMTAPALCVIPIAAAFRRWHDSRRWQSVMEGMLLASAALVLATARSLLPDAIVDVPTAAGALAALAVALATKLPSIWVILGGAALTVSAQFLRLP